MCTTPMTPRCALGRSEIPPHKRGGVGQAVASENSFTSCRTLSETLEPIPPGRRIGLRRGCDPSAPVQVPRSECGPSHRSVPLLSCSLRDWPECDRTFAARCRDSSDRMSRTSARCTPAERHPCEPIPRSCARCGTAGSTETATDSRRFRSNDAANQGRSFAATDTPTAPASRPPRFHRHSPASGAPAWPANPSRSKFLYELREIPVAPREWLDGWLSARSPWLWKRPRPRHAPTPRLHMPPNAAADSHSSSVPCIKLVLHRRYHRGHPCAPTEVAASDPAHIIHILPELFNLICYNY